MHLNLSIVQSNHSAKKFNTKFIFERKINIRFLHLFHILRDRNIWLGFYNVTAKLFLKKEVFIFPLLWHRNYHALIIAPLWSFSFQDSYTESLQCFWDAQSRFL